MSKKTQTGKRMVLVSLSIIVAIVMTLGNIFVDKVQAASMTDKITIKAYISLLMKASGASKTDLVKPGEFSNMSLYINNESAAIIADRADQYKNGKSYNKELYSQVVTKKRISDIAKATKDKRASIYRCFVKGIMVGNSNGSYTQDRTFKPKEKLLLSEAKKVAERVKTKSKRLKLSYDGQLIRTVNLPSNSKNYSYILASFPNSFYEAKFQYQLGKFSYTPVEFIDYCVPKRLIKMPLIEGKTLGEFWKSTDGDKLITLIEKNLKYRFNYNYKTTNKSKWISAMATTYNDSASMAKILKRFTEEADKRKVVLKSSQIILEPSTAYWNIDTLRVRCHAKIIVTANTWETYDSGNQNGMVFSENTYLLNLNKNKWYSFDFDIAIGQTAYGQDFSDWSLLWSDDQLGNAGK